MFAVLTANGFMVADLFFQGKDGTKALLHKYYHIAGVPSYFLFLGKVSFVVALPYFTETVYGRNGEGWTTAVVVTAFLAGGLVLVVFGRFLMSKTLAEDGQEGQEAEERDSTSAEQGQRSTVRSCRSKLGDIFLLTSYWQSLFHDKNMSEVGGMPWPMRCCSCRWGVLKERPILTSVAAIHRSGCTPAWLTCSPP